MSSIQAVFSARRERAVGPKKIVGASVQRRTNPAAKWALRLGLPIVIIFAWQGVETLNWVSPLFSGYPSGIAISFWHLLSTSSVLSDLGTTVVETYAGFAISAIIGLLVAYIFVRSQVIREALYPLATGANAVPRIALMPVLIVWFGLGVVSKIVLIISFVSFTIFVTAVGVLSTVDRDSLLLAGTLGFSHSAYMRKFVLPGAIPTLGAALELGLVYSFLGAIMGEMIGGYAGLGVALVDYSNEYKTNEYFAVLIFVVVITLISVGLLRYFVRRLTRWQLSEARSSSVEAAH